MSKKNTGGYAKSAMDNPVAVWIMAILGILMGIFFIVSQGENKPITRAEAESYTGYFDHYDTDSKNYREIHFKDGSVYDIYAHTERSEFREKMKSLARGTKLYILVNPNNHYVVEVRTDSQELLNFETSQQEIDAYDNGYIFIGIVACVCGVFLIVYAIGSAGYKRKEEARHAERGTPTVPLRSADETVKCKILLEAATGGYRICYRRVKSVNELVVNGKVYDEKKGIVEFAHKLCALVDGHSIEAGYDEESYSYICFDGQRIKEKRRLI